MSRLAALVFATVWCLGLPVPARAQDAASESPAHISLVDGAAVLERDGRNETAPTSMPLLAGDRVRTQNGRVEILYADGSTLHLDTNTLVDFQSDEVVRLLDGRVRLNIIGPRRRIDYRVDAPSAWVQIATPGEYRISVIAKEREPEVELAVLRGAADLVNEDGRTSLAAGERAFARAGAGPSASYVYNSAAWDAFDRWSEARRDSRLGVSAEYLPEEVQPYAATFSSYGYWQNVPTYGYVWYPHVHPGWRPYYYGRWNHYRPWGWTWVGSDPWAWPTHHYGRWGFNAGAWFWIPGRVWGPAWVSWAYAPSYVSWCPLGWNNQAVFAFNFHSGYRHNPWNAWTVVPHRGFGTGFVNVNVVNASRIDVRTRNSFVVRDTAPDVRGYAVPRATAPIRVAGARTNGATAGTAGFSRTPSPGMTQTAPAGSDPAATLRSRRSPSTPLNGQGYPAPAREPRDLSTIPAPTRQATPRARDGAGVISSPPAVRSDTRSDVRSPVERRAVPRDERPTEPSSPTPMYSPSPSYGAPRERSPYRGIPSAEAPGQDPSPSRAVPRSAPSGGVPDGYARSRPGPEHSAPAPSSPGPSAAPRSSAPSGPPPSAAPPPQRSAPSGPPPAASGGGESRSRSSAPASGHAMPRGGRGGH
jgi:Family of unknown function (DUF6600)/FecR protein